MEPDNGLTMVKSLFQSTVTFEVSSKAFLINNQPMVAWINSFSFDNDVIDATYLDPNGDFIWQPGLREIGSNSNGDARLNGAANSRHFGMYVWSENEMIKGQNLNQNGGIGTDIIFASGFED